MASLPRAASGIGAFPLLWTNSRRPTNPRSLRICWRPFVWVEGTTLVLNMAHRRETLSAGILKTGSYGVGTAMIDGTKQAVGVWAVSYVCLFCFLCHAAVFTPRPCPPPLSAYQEM